MEFINQFKELGIALSSILIFAYLIWKFITVHKEELDNSRKERLELMTDYRNFVQENNHSKSELIEKHTEALVEVRDSIKENTQIIRDLMVIYKNMK